MMIIQYVDNSVIFECCAAKKANFEVIASFSDRMLALTVIAQGYVMYSLV